ncbi:MAG: hypothetical protein AB3N14_18595 [Flavobacteriaceae bacterium]
MNKDNLITSIALGLLISNGLMAHKPCEEKDPCVIDSVVYLEDEAEIELGFDVADYLPEDFDPYTFYFNINSVEFLNEEEVEVDFSRYLPEGFDPYAAPKDFRDISYIDREDDIELDIKSPDNLPTGIDAYISK